MPAWHNLAHPRRIPSYLSTWQDDGEEVTWRNYKGELTDNQRKLQEKIQKRLQKVTAKLSFHPSDGLHSAQ